MDSELEAPVLKLDDSTYQTECFITQGKEETGGRLVAN
jgi:hypothetical protein